MLFFDTATVSGARRTADGYLVADVRAGRIGIQLYKGSEIGRPDLSEVRVYRAPEQVFAADAMSSAAFKPVTNDHPPEMVNAGNWAKYAVGQLGGEVARDGEFLRVPMVMMDAKAIADVESGKRELSLGYWSTVKFEAGITAAGEQYDAVQSQISINHLAVVDHARGGSKLRIGDMRGPDDPALLERNDTMADPALKTVMVDGISIQTTDQGAQVIEKLMKQIADALKGKADAEAKAATDATTAKTAFDTKVAEVVTLTKQLADAKVTPQQLRDAAKAYAVTVETAKKLAPNLTVTDAMDEGAIRKAVVTAQLGDIAKDWNDAQFAASFAALAKNPSSSDTHTDPMRDALSSGIVSTDAKAQRDAAYAEMLERDANAWKRPAPKAA